jgi:hypothetical protein
MQTLLLLKSCYKHSHILPMSLILNPNRLSILQKPTIGRFSRKMLAFCKVIYTIHMTPKPSKGDSHLCPFPPRGTPQPGDCHLFTGDFEILRIDPQNPTVRFRNSIYRIPKSSGRILKFYGKIPESSGRMSKMGRGQGKKKRLDLQVKPLHL